MKKKKRITNWNEPHPYARAYWKQNTTQYWLAEEIPVGQDDLSWLSLKQEERNLYARILVGLTALDTLQGNEGMTNIMLAVDDLQVKAVLQFMGAMEEVHAESYSRIFTTLMQVQEIDDLFYWGEENPYINIKLDVIGAFYKDAFNSPKALYMAMVASTLLESFLFYSGFFYPLYLAGLGKMKKSVEIIKLIIRDEAVHGSFVGRLAQDLYATFDEGTKQELHEFSIDLMNELYENELAYTEELYDELGLTHEVKKYIRFNANRALMNLGFEPHFEEEEINPIVLNGINTDTKNHDFFSQKGTSYQIGKVENLRDEDFDFDRLKK